MTDRERIIETLRASGYGFFVTHKKANADEALADTANALIENGYRKQSEVEQKTARDIIYRLRHMASIGHLRSELDLLCCKYGVEEDEQ